MKSYEDQRADWIRHIAMDSFQPMPEGLNGAERIYFATLRYLMRCWQARGITDAERQREEKTARVEYGRNVLAARYIEHEIQNRVRIERAERRYRKERTLEAADAFIAAVNGIVEKPITEWNQS